MTIDALVDNMELLKRILEHYRYRLDNFPNDVEIKPLLSGPVRRHLTFGRLKSSISEALTDLTKEGNAAKLKSPPYSDLVTSAARQYLKDLERIKKKIEQDLPDAKLKELELDIEAMKACLR
jgi:hypothetical protein